METQKHNIYIVDDNKLMAGMLRKFLLSRFENKVNVSLYFSGESALKRMHQGVNLVILDYYLNEKGKNAKQGVEVLQTMKAGFPETEVVMYTSNEDVVTAIEAMRSGASDYIVKNKSSWYKISSLVDRIIAQPIRALLSEFGVLKFLSIFLLTFFTMAVVVIWALNVMHSK